MVLTELAVGSGAGKPKMILVLLLFGSYSSMGMCVLLFSLM